MSTITVEEELAEGYGDGVDRLGNGTVTSEPTRLEQCKVLVREGKLTPQEIAEQVDCSEGLVSKAKRELTRGGLNAPLAALPDRLRAYSVTLFGKVRTIISRITKETEPRDISSLATAATKLLEASERLSGVDQGDKGKGISLHKCLVKIEQDTGPAKASKHANTQPIEGAE